MYLEAIIMNKHFVITIGREFGSGGREVDMPRLKEYVGGRHISAWILTHAHDDHISGLISEVKKNNLSDLNI